MTDSERLKAKKQGQEQQEEEQQRPAAVNDSDTETNDLRELNLSATFLTPYAVAPAQDQRVWLSNTKQTYVDFSGYEGQGWLCFMTNEWISRILCMHNRFFYDSLHDHHLTKTNRHFLHHLKQTSRSQSTCCVGSRKIHVVSATHL